MIANEFGMIQKKLHGAFSMLSDMSDQQVWYEALKKFDYADVDASVSQFIYSNNRRPTIADIVEGANINKMRRQRPPDIRPGKTVKCPYCNDTGLVIKQTLMSYVGHPCTECEMGRLKHPWDFKTEDEKEEYIKEEERQGLKPPRSYFEASKEFYMNYHYGIEV